MFQTIITRMFVQFTVLKDIVSPSGTNILCHHLFFKDLNSLSPGFLSYNACEGFTWPSLLYYLGTAAQGTSTTKDWLATSAATSKELPLVSSLGGSQLLKVPIKLWHANLLAWSRGEPFTVNNVRYYCITQGTYSFPLNRRKSKKDRI